MHIVDFLLISQNNPSEDKPTMKQQLSSRRVKNSYIIQVMQILENIK
jgi:hypothetical protein